jgi:hypothetical protein
MRDKFHTILLVILAFALGYTLASRPAQAWGNSIGDSAYRMANTLDRIEQHLARCPR